MLKAVVAGLFLSTIAYSQCDCGATYLISYQRFTTNNCQFRFLARSAPNGPIPTIDLTQNPPVISVPAEGGTYEIDVETDGLELSWPSSTECTYELQETDVLPAVTWTKVGYYKGMATKTVLSVPIYTDRNRFFRVKTVCP